MYMYEFMSGKRKYQLEPLYACIRERDGEGECERERGVSTSGSSSEAFLLSCLDQVTEHDTNNTSMDCWEHRNHIISHVQFIHAHTSTVFSINSYTYIALSHLSTHTYLMLKLLSCLTAKVR